jgi:hypothetical protein
VVELRSPSSAQLRAPFAPFHRVPPSLLPLASIASSESFIRADTVLFNGQRTYMLVLSQTIERSRSGGAWTCATVRLPVQRSPPILTTRVSRLQCNSGRTGEISILRGSICKFNAAEIIA